MNCRHFVSCLALALALALAAAAVRLEAQAVDTTVKVAIGGFIDTYYAYDLGRPSTFDRSFLGGAAFTTQPARHNEFNVNLAYLEAVISGDRLRGRLALQAGTSVQSNYAAEPANGSVSGPSLSRSIQEAYAGYQVASSLWIDAGVFYSNMGMESWASKDNPVYTRSLVADYSPYYSSGARATWQASPRLSVRLDVVNGWQNVSETNSDKGAGLRLDYAASPSLGLSYYNFVNGETGGRVRLFNGIGGKLAAGRAQVLAQVDYGRLSAPSSGGSPATGYGFTAIGRAQVSSRAAVVGRVERFDDEGQVNVATALADPFRANGASIGLDVAPRARLLWRTEARGFLADAPIFPDATAAAKKSSAFVVTSMALVF